MKSRLVVPAFIVFSFFLTSIEAMASHAVGADLIYTCLGGNQYKITLNFYRDCAGATAPTSPSISIRTVSGCGSSSNVTLTLQSSKEVTSICPSQISNSRCNGGLLPGIQQYIYSATVTLSAQCSDWVISYSLCCRNAAITNLSNPGSQDLYVEARLNNTNGMCNNSPIFTTLPVPYICVNQKINYNHGAIDLDGDLLTYQSINPLDNQTTNISYSSGSYNPNNPLSLTGAFFLDSQTGQLVFTPNAVQNAVITIKVSEYRNGVLIGSTMRDMQFIVINCNNNVPTATGIDGTSNFSINMCRNQLNCFAIFTNDIDPGQTLTLTWNNAIPGATFVPSGPPHPKGTFCWTPGPQHSGSYTFLVTVQDDACPLFGTNVYAYTINVVDGITHTISKTPLKCFGDVDATATATGFGGSGVYNYMWGTSPTQTTPTATGLKAGSYFVTITDPLGCGMIIDNILITEPLLLQVAPVITNADCGVNNGEVALSVSGGSGSTYTYQWSNFQNGSSISGVGGGTYAVTVSDSLLCTITDSFIIRQQTIGPNIVKLIQICNGQSYFAGGIYQTQAGTYFDTLLNSIGCDSIVETHLSFLASSFFAVAAQICNGDSLLAGGIYRHQSGVYFDTLAASNGCDSIVETTLTVFSQILSQQLVTICSGESFFAGGALQTSAGIYRDTLTATNGCDSILTTTLTVQAVSVDTFAITICLGDSVLAGGGQQNQPGFYSDTFSTTFGCDSIIVLQLTVLSPANSSRQISICQGDSVNAGGGSQTQPGSYYDTLTGSNGCDSVLVTQLIVLPPAALSRTVSICNGDSYFTGGASQTQAGTYFDTLTAANGCDSIISTQLNILSNTGTSFQVTICDGDSFLVAGIFQKQTGIYFDTLSSFNGCDSVITTALIVIAPSISNVQVSICNGESYYAGGALQIAFGFYSDTFISVFGCDSIIVTELIVNNGNVVNDSITICNKDSVYLEGRFQNTPGIYYDSLLNKVGCDSIIITQLVVVPFFFGSVSVTICATDSFFSGGAFQNTPGLYRDTILSSVGCDSIIDVNLSVVPVFINSRQISICANDSFFAGGSFQSTGGFYYDTLTSASGCDSIIITDLVVFPVYGISNNVVMCEGDSFFAGGSHQFLSGTYYDNLATAQGCDSIITTQLVVINTLVTRIQLEICFGNGVFISGNYQTTSGFYYDTLSAVTGCDSIIETQLTVIAPVTTHLQFNFCEGDSIFAGGKFRHDSGFYYDSLFSFRACDSIVESQLIKHFPTLTSVSQIICENDSFFAGGSYQTTNGIYYDNYTSIYGCDSVVETTLGINPVFRFSVKDSICDDESILIGGTFRDSPGIYLDTLTGVNSCDTILTIDLTVLPVVPPQGQNFIICRDETVQLNGGNGHQTYLWNQGETTATISVPPGLYHLNVWDFNGCRSSVDFLVDAHPLIELYTNPDSDTILDGGSVTVEAISGNSVSIASFLWSPTSGMNCDNCQKVTIQPQENQVYRVIAFDINGCPDTAFVSIILDRSPRIYVPNAFTPNGDNVNDRFMVYVTEWQRFFIKIFDRWGEKVFESNDPNIGWDGTYLGTLLNPGVYVYFIDVKFNGKDLPDNYYEYQRGSVTLIR